MVGALPERSGDRRFPAGEVVVLVSAGGGRKLPIGGEKLPRNSPLARTANWSSAAGDSRFIRSLAGDADRRRTAIARRHATPIDGSPMPNKTWTLLDVAKDVYLDSFVLGASELTGAAAGLKVRKRRLQGGLRDGVDSVEIDNGKFSITVLPTRGMGLWKAKSGDLELGWKAPPQGPVHPRHVNLWEPSGLGWLGGFDELLCRCGLESNGGPVHDEQGKLVYPLHGKIANLPAHTVTLSIDSDTGELTLVGIVDEARLYHSKLRLTSTLRTRPGESGVRITDEVQNLSAEPGEMELVYHVNFGPPLLEAGAKVVAPVKQVVPMTPRAAEGVNTWDVYAAEEPGFTEQVYLFELAADSAGKTHALLRNAHGNFGASLSFDVRQLPCFTVWKSTQDGADGYVTGLEPGVNFPNQRTYEAEQGRIVKLEGGESRTFDLQLVAHPNAESVATMEQSIAALQKGIKPRVRAEPIDPWSPK